MTQLYVGNLSSEADEKVLRAVFGKYGPVREAIMKNGYAFVEFESPKSADAAMTDLHGAEILGSRIVVEPSHQQRVTKRKMLSSRVEVTDIPMCLTWESVETQLASVGNIMKSEHDIDDYGNLTGYVLYESVEQAQRAESTFSEEESMFKVAMWDEKRPASAGAVHRRKSSFSLTGPLSPAKQQSEFPLRVLVPGEMVGAIIGKDGATIRAITQATKAKVDIDRRDAASTSAGVSQNDKTITINGSPECCTEACHMIMKIMQQELLTQNGYTTLHGSLERLPSVPLKILAHNDLIGRVIGKGGNTLKRIMQESGTKITISKLKDLTPQKPERTITIMGTVDNCKKAESLISAKLRASYENDMAHLIPQQQHALHKYIGVPGTSALFSGLSLSSDSAEHFLPHSLPTSPVVPQTFGEFALVGPPKYAQPPSTAATATLELSGLSGFSHPACPQDTTLLASQLSSGASPQRLGSSGGMMPVPPQTVDLTAKLDELQEEDVEEVSTAFGDFQLGVAPQIKRQSSAPTLIQPMWGGSHPSSTDQTLLSPGHVPTSVSFFQALSEETEPPEDGLRPQEAWSEHRVGSHPHPHQEKEDNYMFYNPIQSPVFAEHPSIFEPPPALHSPPPYGPPSSFPFMHNVVMTSKLTGSPIKVRPEGDTGPALGTAQMGWGSPNVESAKSSLAFSFDFASYQQPDITKVTTPPNSTDGAIPYNLMA